MSCTQCKGVEEEFSPAIAERQLRRYRRRGVKKTTRWLIDAIISRRLDRPSLLDIGGGVGEIQHELAAAGTSRVVNVDASSAYQSRAREEAERRGYAPVARYVYGNFTDVAHEIEDADVVTMDRVICCYDDIHTLMGLSVARARRLYGLVFPRETWWMRVGFIAINGIQRIRRAPFKVFLHSSSTVNRMLASAGFERTFYRTSFLWQVALYRRSS